MTYCLKFSEVQIVVPPRNIATCSTQSTNKFNSASNGLEQLFCNWYILFYVTDIFVCKDHKWQLNDEDLRKMVVELLNWWLNEHTVQPVTLMLTNSSDSTTKLPVTCNLLLQKMYVRLKEQYKNNSLIFRIIRITRTQEWFICYLL